MAIGSDMKTKYRVSWFVDVEAESAEDAALEAERLERATSIE
jgi:hypothetical protein